MKRAAELFLDQGYEGTSVEMIARRAGASKQTIYVRFPSKADLFTAVFRRKADAFFGNLSQSLSESVDLEAEKRRAAERDEFLRKEIKRAEGKLANEGFVAKAPEAVVKAEREKLEQLRRELDELT